MLARSDTVCLYGIRDSMAESLTSTQSKVLAFVEQSTAQNGHPPTMKEVSRHFGWSSTSTAQQHLGALQKKGRLDRIPKSPRSLRVTKPLRPTRVDQTVAVPLVGRIAAGVPIYALEEAEEVLPLPRALFHGSSLFALRVKGDSMMNAGIFDGDIAILRAGPEFLDGDIAAVIVDEEATLKRVFKTKRGLRLQAENPDFADRVVSSEQIKQSFRLAGVLVGTIRRFT
jgi:repressor LexA